ncbi:MAG: peptidyl-prolyl cis-trans isomerase [Acidobacteriota bacterium]|nr:peptidyl-prolyl cis-trans isomerase [Acidobacteriota bacterium]
MTMLDRMRRHKGWLKWSLGLVVIAFVLVYIPDFVTPQSAGAAPNAVVATVDGRDIKVSAFQRAYTQQVQSYRQAYGANLNDQMLRQLGIEQRVLSQMIDEEAVLAEADRLGIKVTDAELRERILRLPAFQENGAFIGDQRYRQILAAQRPPIPAEDFERELRRQLQADKLREALTGWVTITDAEVAAEYKRRNEKVKVDLVLFNADAYKAGITPSDSDIASHFEANKARYKVPEKRRVRYLHVDAATLRDRVTVTEQDARTRYTETITQYQQPEQVRASHILLKTEGKDEAAVRKQAEGILAQVKAGGDLAALATKFSEDESSKTKGGDVGFFGKSAMVKEFEDAAFALQPGQTTDLVKTPYGFHIIRLTDKKAAATQPFEAVSAQIQDQIKSERAQQEVQRVAEELDKEIDDPSDIDRVAQARGLTAADSPLFAKEEPVPGLGFAPDVSAQAFSMERGKVSDAIRTPQGAAFITVIDVQAPHDPQAADVRDRVRDAVINERASAMARERASALAATFKSDFAGAAKAAGLTPQSSELVARGQALPEVGINPQVEEAAFALPAGGVSEPIATDRGTAVLRIADKQGIKPEAFATERDQVRGQVEQERKGQFFASYMTKAKQKMKIDLNEETLQALMANR